MIQDTLNSPVSVEVRSISTFLLILAPAVGLLVYSNWSLHGSSGKRRDHAAAAPIGDRPFPGSPATTRVRSWADLRAFPFSQRADFVAGMHHLLIQFGQRHAASGDSPQAATLREAQGRIRMELDSLELATSSTWESAKQEVGEAWRNLQAIGGDAALPDGS